jgi:type I restriction enzyme S subunit
MPKQVANVPNLRFPGFEIEWERKRLGEVTIKINSGKTPLGGESVYTDEGVIFIRSQNINNERLELENSVFISAEINQTMQNSVVLANDILLNITGASLGRSCVVPDGFTIGNVNQHVCIIRVQKEYNPRFIQPFLSSNKGQSILQSLQTGSGREGLNFESIKRIELYFPPSKEQNKISSFLSLLDERIATQSKIIEDLRNSKTTLGKKIFARQLRFPEFTNEWNAMRLGEVCEKQGSNISANKIEDNFGDYSIYGASGEFKKVNFYEVENNYIGIVKDGAGVGRLFYCKGKSSVLGTLDVIKPNKNVNAYFLYCLLSCIDFSKHCIGSTIPHIYFKDYAKERIKIPPKKEQKKIAEFLFTIDKKIEIETALLNLVIKQKNYLVHQLFI